LTGKAATLQPRRPRLRRRSRRSPRKTASTRLAIFNATAKIGKLEAEARTAEERAAEYYGAGGKPAAVTAKGQGDDELVAQFKAITNPAAQTTSGATSRRRSSRNSNPS